MIMKLLFAFCLAGCASGQQAPVAQAQPPAGAKCVASSGAPGCGGDKCPVALPVNGTTCAQHWYGTCPYDDGESCGCVTPTGATSGTWSCSQQNAHQARAACSVGADQTCNDLPTMSSLAGTCQPDGTCKCRDDQMVINPSTGKCRPAGSP